MDSFKITEGYGNHCNECGQTEGGKTSNILEFNGVVYTLCDTCFRRFLGELYLKKTDIFEELIKTLAQRDRNHMLSLINNPRG